MQVPAPHGFPVYEKEATPPTADETAARFTLDPQQQRVFNTLVSTLQARAAGLGLDEFPQQCIVVQGEPGAGKSQVFKAFLWWAFQHGLSDRVAICAYTWRAALNIATPVNPSYSTATFFAINPFNGDKVQPPGSAAYTSARTRLRPPLALLLIDEFSFISLEHLCGINKSLQLHRGSMAVSAWVLRCVHRREQIRHT